MEFSEKVRYAREQLQISQEDLAHALNVSYATVNRWENSRTKPLKITQLAFLSFCENHGVDFELSNKVGNMMIYTDTQK